MQPDICQQFAPLFSPRTVAVIGASGSGNGPANEFIRRLLAFGFSGAIYPIHRSAAEIEGLTAYPSLADTPEVIDYAYVAIAAELVPGALVAGTGRVRFVQVMSSGFGESGDDGGLERHLLKTVRDAGMRLIGPNCLGTHSTAGRLTFVDNAQTDPGPVGILSQSGGLSVDILRRGQGRGIRFSRLVTLGNCADVGPNELLDYLIADSQTRVIGLYLEDLSDGREFFLRLRQAEARKPVVLLKGGRTAQGQRAAASHTGTLASDDRLWVAMARQTGTVLVDTLEEFLDSLVALQTLVPNPQRATERVVLFGNGGGTGVLGVDCLQKAGFHVPALGDKLTTALHDLALPAGSSIQNPIDTPASALRSGGGAVASRILAAVHEFGDIDAVILHLNLTVILGYRDDGFLDGLLCAALSAHDVAARSGHFLLVLRSDGDPLVESAKRTARSKAAAMGIPVFDEIANAVCGLAATRTIERFRLSRCSPVL